MTEPTTYREATDMEILYPTAEVKELWVVPVKAVTIPLIGRCGCCDRIHRLDLPLPSAGNGDNDACDCACHWWWPSVEPDWVHKGECRCNGDEYKYTPGAGNGDNDHE